MRITCVIDTLLGGGAQRQLCNLAVLFAEAGHSTTIIAYHPGDFFLPLLQKAGVDFVLVDVPPNAGQLAKASAVRRVLRRLKPDVVLAFLDGPCFYSTLAGLPIRPWGLVVSERIAIPGSHLARFPWRRHLHRLADFVTANSHTNRLMIEATVPSLADKVVTIYNAVDLDRFHPKNRRPFSEDQLRIVIPANYHEKKNMLGVIRGLAKARKTDAGRRITIDWYGAKKAPESAFEASVQAIREHGLKDFLRLNPPTQQIEHELASADAMCLASFYEGLSNSVCEALAAGCPVLASAATDNGSLVIEGKNGFMFDPADDDSIADALVRFGSTTRADLERMSRESRCLAETVLNGEIIGARYLEVLTAAAARKRTPIAHWPSEVPATAKLI